MLLRFTDADAAQGWRNRPEITAKLAEITALTGEAARIVESVGLGLWADHVSGAAPALPLYWKRVVMAVLAVYPMLMILLPLSRPLVWELPQPLQTRFVVVVLACLLTWPIMPTLGKILRPWLAAR